MRLVEPEFGLIINFKKTTPCTFTTERTRRLTRAIADSSMPMAITIVLDFNHGHKTLGCQIIKTPSFEYLIGWENAGILNEFGNDRGKL